MTRRHFAMWVLFLVVAAAPSWAAPVVTIVETYDGPADQITWGVSPYFDQIESSGGSDFLQDANRRGACVLPGKVRAANQSLG